MQAPGPSFHVFGWNISRFQFLGVLGFVAAGATALALASYLGLSLPIFCGLIVAAAATFFALVLVTRAILGEERIVYYHHEIAVLTVSGLVVYTLGRPVLPYLDVVVVAMAVFLVFGRLGCASVGCCHGRPHGFGWRYGHEHADVGFPRVFVGVPLVPVQLLESLAVLALTLWAIVQLVAGAPAGTVLATQLTAYAILRFFLELVRGDTLRPAWRSFSEAQWTLVVLALGVVCAERVGWLPVSPWRVVAAGCVAFGFVVVGLARARSSSTHRLLTPSHVQEVAQALLNISSDLSNGDEQIVRVSTTLLGVRLSSCIVAEAHNQSEICTLSGLDEPGARTLSRLIVGLRSPANLDAFFERGPGLFQFVVKASSIS